MEGVQPIVHRRHIVATSVAGIALVVLGSPGGVPSAFGQDTSVCANKAVIEKAFGQALSEGVPKSLGGVAPDTLSEDVCIYDPPANAPKGESVWVIRKKTSGPKVFERFLTDAKGGSGISDLVLAGTDKRAFLIGQDVTITSKVARYIDRYGVVVALPKVTLWVEQTDADGDDDNMKRLVQLATQLVQGPYLKGNPPCEEAQALANAVFPEFTRPGKLSSGKMFTPKVEKNGCSWSREDDRDSSVTVTTSKAGDYKKVLAVGAGPRPDPQKFIEFDASGRPAFITRAKRDLATVSVNDTTILTIQLNTPGKGPLLKSKARDIALAVAPLFAKP